MGFLDLGFGTVDHFGEWLGLTAPSADTTVSDDVITTAISWSVGIAGGLLIWRAYADPARLERIKAPLRWWPRWPSTSSTSTSCMTASATPPFAAIAVGLYRWVERYLIWGSITVLSITVRSVSRGVAAAQTGLVRSYAVTLVAGAALLAVYFLTKANL